MPTDAASIARFEAKYLPEPNSGCWLWTGAQHRWGYGKINWKGTVLDAHRASWDLHRGPIPDGACVLHRCDVPACVNPEHLFLGTQRLNMTDMCLKNRQVKGERNGQAKITLLDVIAIREDHRFQRVIAKEYGISQQQVSRIRRAERWASGWSAGRG